MPIEEQLNLAEIDFETLAEIDQEALLLVTFDWFSKQTLRKAERVPPLIARVVEFTETGKLTIKFNNDMLIPPYLQSDEGEDISASTFRLDSILHLQVISSYHEAGSELIQIEASSIVRYQSNQMVIQITFDNPAHISLDALDKDSLVIKVI